MASVDLVRAIEREQMKDDLPEIKSGDTIRVHFRIVEGDRERTQAFEGVVIRLRGSQSNRTITVRRTGAHGVGVERVFPIHSPRVEKIEVLRHAHVRRAKLYFLRERQGKAARLKQKR
jgi:large subunit ribosomal protein L19